MPATRRYFKFGALLASVVGVFAATSPVAAGSTLSPKVASGPLPANTVVVSYDFGGSWPCSFNPFLGGQQFLSFGNIYEPLMFVNSLQSGKTTPWLASGYSWSNGNDTLTFTIRSGVKWSSGQPFSPADVVFTFDLLKKYPALGSRRCVVGPDERFSKGQQSGSL